MATESTYTSAGRKAGALDGVTGGASSAERSETGQQVRNQVQLRFVPHSCSPRKVATVIQCFCLTAMRMCIKGKHALELWFTEKMLVKLSCWQDGAAFGCNSKPRVE